MGLFSLRSLLLAAILLSNYLAWTATRHHHTHNLSRHRSRHRRQGAGLYLPGSYVVPGGEGSGAWGEWGEVSACSRTCGGGVASQKRICLEVSPEGQPLCTGGDTKFFSCQTQDCPDQADYRSQQCAEYDEIAFRGIKYKWLPYTNAPNPCELNCMPRGERFYFRQKTKVVDGTRCNDESFDVCVNGTCQPVGCDMMLGSNAREDKCRECRGNGTNCRTISGLIDSPDLRKGYNDVLLIPQGSTSIYISEVRASNNYLALRSKQDNVYYLNGEYHIDFPRSLTIAGVIWHYERSQQGFAAPDKLRCLGPTTEPLYLSLLLQDENVGIEYEYSLPAALAPPPNQQYNWVYEDFSPCSTTCGGGTQTRLVTCRSREELEVVEDSLCDDGLKPVTNQTCNTDPCPPRWVEEPWGPCSKPCGEGGTRSRQVYCQKIIFNGLQSIVSDKECLDLLGPKPALYQECNRNASCPTWFAGPWKPCDKLCDEGKQTRQVVCHQRINGKVEVFDDSMCQEEKPATEQGCMLRPCEGVDWVLSDWSGCDTCTSTVRTRVAFCATNMHNVVNSSFCSYHPAPVLEEPCDRTKLPSCQLLWYATQWSKCSVECGKGVQSRRVFCGLFDGASVVKVDDDRCDSKMRYNDTKVCEVPSEKCDAKWYAGPWSKCSKDCDGGQQFRRVMCLSGGVEVNTCSEETILDKMQSCNMEPCSNDTKATPIKAEPEAEDYYDYEECIDEDYPEAGAEIIPSGGVTIEDVMFSDSPATDEGSADYETQFTLETGSGSEPTDLWTTDETGSGSSSTDFTDETTVFTSISDTTESTVDETESELTGEFIPISSKKPLYSSSRKSDAASKTDSTTEPTSKTSDSSASSVDTSSEAGTGSTETEIIGVSTEGSTDSSTTSEVSETSSDGSTETTDISSTETSTLENTEITGSSEGVSSSVSETDLTESSESTVTENTESTETGASSASTEPVVTDTAETDSTKSASESSSISDGTEIIDETESSTTEVTTSDKESSATTELDTEATKKESTTTESSTSDSAITTGSTESEPTETTESTETETTVSEITESESTGSTKSESSFSTESGSSVSTESSSSVSMESESSISTESVSSVSTESVSSVSTESASSVSTESGSSVSTESVSSVSTESGSSVSTESGSSVSTESVSSLSTESGSSVSTESESSVSTESVSSLSTESGSSVSTESGSSGSTESVSSVSTESGSSLSTESGSSASIESGSITSTESGSSASTESGSSGSTEPGSSTITDRESSTTESELSTTTESGSSTTESELSVTTESGSSTSTTEFTDKETTVSESSMTTESTELENTESSSDTTETSVASTESSSTVSLEVSTTEVSVSSLSTTESTESEKTDTTEETASTTESGSTTETTEETTTSSGSTLESSESSSIQSLSTTESYSTEESTSIGTESKFEGLSTTEISTETEMGTDRGTTPWDWSTTVGVYSTKLHCKVRRKVPKCIKSKYGCCSDNKTPAKGPFEEGCQTPKTCKETKHGCCPDGVSPATGPRSQGCPLPPCSETLFGCCLSDNVTAAEDNDQQGCPPVRPPCANTTYGCCPDDKTEAKGPRNKGCPEEELEKEPTGCFASDFGCCADNSTAASGPDDQGCPCNITAFGCCPDGVSPAQGVQMEGCVLSCNATEFGCCADGETPAHGPEQEGCCLQYRFGCCPDNYKPAAGPHLEGCGCADSHFGCCPDNVTIARGPNNEGCGCQYTEFGCCPDRHTNATGPDYEGCHCSTYQFGCCPDGITVSTGPNLEGCRCQYSQFGCCGDEVTAAVGPDQFGCDCASSKYGCCPDGQTEAKGEKFSGCIDVPVNKQEACSLPTERGSCRNYTVQWYYDMEYGGCSRFWYGGCDGNSNRFGSKEECEDVCVQPSPKEACNLPKVKGACVGYNLRWYYDAEQQVCGQFVFGGCLGNANNFESRELCQAQCEPDRHADECELPMEEGPCAGNYARWFFDQKTRRCYQFVWGGCAGNANRFHSEAACMHRCNPPGSPQPDCVEPQDAGNCTEKHATWSFSQTENRCVPFYYTGCNGNGNRFDSEASCAASCPSAYEPDICVLPAQTGECADYTQKWFYDTANKGCRQFYYGGCGGNDNRFDSQRDCETRCSDVPTTTTTMQPTSIQTTRPVETTTPTSTTILAETTRPVETTQPVQQVQPPQSADQRPDFCALELDPGPCENLVSRWGYDGSLGTCITFMYGGCGGNRNNFPSQEYCNYYCPDKLTNRFDPVTSEADVCKLPMRAGPCDQSLMRWFYDPSTDSCSQFTYGGCEGNGNRFESLEDCKSRCKTRTEPETTTSTSTTTTTPATSTVSDLSPLPQICIVSPILEECSGAGTVWYADSSRQCVPHTNADSGTTCRNTGVFNSPEACMRSCGAFRNINVCGYPVDAGPCRSFEPKFYFDSGSSSCQQFLYGGCYGGPNRFSTFDECEEVCKPESDPCKMQPEPGNCLAYLPMWYYDESRDQCNQFVYSGCNGNGNRFDTQEDCEGRCKKQPTLTTTTTVPSIEVTTSTTTTTTTTTTTAAPTTTQRILVEEQCRRPESLEPCGTSAAVFYYDETRGACLPAEFGNCHYANSYRSEEECERRCGVFSGLDVCRYRLDPGPCNETGIMKVYWDVDSRRCKPFAYGGCQGGPNRFSSIHECEEVCGLNGPDTNEVLPECEAYSAECSSLRCAYGVQRMRTADGCERCVCVQVEVDCAPLQRECELLKCYYGMVNETGDDGCQRCRCLDHPCASKKCAEGERCVPTVFRDPVLQEISYVAGCNVMNKTGSCPSVEEMPPVDGTCRRECNDDADCRGEGKCCEIGCSQLCLAPVTGAANYASTSAAPPTAAYQPELPQPPRANSATEPDVTAAEGGKATLRCLFHGNPPPKITWRRGEITIDGTMDRYRLLSDGVLEIVSLYRNDSGVYICIADNGLGIARQEIRLLVNDPVEEPVGIAGETNAVVMGELNRVLNIRCMAYGYPMPFIQWFRGLSGPMVPYSSSLYEARGSVLQIRRLDIETLGDYACQAYNGVGKPASWSVVVKAYRPEGDDSDNPYLVDRKETVLFTSREFITEATTTPAPEITVPVYTVPVTTRILSSVTTVATGAQLTLPCEVDGYPEPEVRWTKDGVPLVASDRIDITETRLTITSTNINDSGLYGCHASNAFSSHSSTLQITVEGLYIPPTCKDNPFFANCHLIVRSKFCTHKYYSNFCCKSCVEAGLLNPLDLAILVK